MNEQRMKTPVFIVSTGRCGSTMMSNLIRKHPRILSISEFFTALSTMAFRGGRLDGESLYKRLNTLSPAGKALLRSGLLMDEFLYKFGPEARYRPEEVPPILCATLPHISDQPETLWDELGDVIRSRPEAELGEQYRYVFDWLANRFEKTAWIERSGASLLFVPTLAKLYPDAKFVHIFRDGRDTALSMELHPFFRLTTNASMLLSRVGVDPYSPFNVPGTSPWMPFFQKLRFKNYTRADYERLVIPQPEFGRFWCGMLARGIQYLNALPQQRVMSLRFETVVQDPEPELRRFMEFVEPGGDHETWLDEVKTIPRYKAPTWHKLGKDAQQALTEACLPGNRILEEMGYPLPEEG